MLTLDEFTIGIMAHKIEPTNDDPLNGFDFSCDDIFFMPTELAITTPAQGLEDPFTQSVTSVSPEDLALSVAGVCESCIGNTEVTLAQAHECIEKRMDTKNYLSITPGKTMKRALKLLAQPKGSTLKGDEILRIVHKQKPHDYRFDSEWSATQWDDVFFWLRNKIQHLIEKWYTASAITGQPFDPKALKLSLTNMTRGIIEKSDLRPEFPAYLMFAKLAIIHSSLTRVVEGQDHALKDLVKVAPNEKVYAKLAIPTSNPFPIRRTVTLVPQASSGIGITGGPLLNKIQLQQLKTLVFGPPPGATTLDAKMSLLSSHLKGSMYHDIIRAPTDTLFSELRKYVLSGRETIEFFFREDIRESMRFRCNSCNVGTDAPSTDGLFPHLCQATVMIAEEMGFECAPEGIRFLNWMPLDVSTSRYVREFLGLAAPTKLKTEENIIDLGLESFSIKSTRPHSKKEADRCQEQRDAQRERLAQAREEKRERQMKYR